MIRRLKLALLALAAAVLLPSPASAATVTGPSTALNVSASVLAKCTITAGSIGFTGLDLTAAVPASPAVTASGSFSVTCTRSATSVNYQLILSSSNLSGTTWNMKNGTFSLPYTITVNGSPFVATTPINFSSSGKTTPNTFNVVATIVPGDYDLIPGLYSDTINAEIQL